MSCSGGHGDWLSPGKYMESVGERNYKCPFNEAYDWSNCSGAQGGTVFMKERSQGICTYRILVSTHLLTLARLHNFEQNQLLLVSDSCDNYRLCRTAPAASIFQLSYLFDEHVVYGGPKY